MFGYQFLPHNFNSPYKRGVDASISGGAGTSPCRSWLRDYLYIPLGGNRGGPLLTLSST